MTAFTTKLQEALNSGLLLNILDREKTLAKVCFELGYSAHGRNTGALTIFLATNNILFKNHSQKTKKLESRNCVHCGTEFYVSVHNKKEYKVLTCSHACSGAYPEFVNNRVIAKVGEAKSYPIIAKRAGLTSCCICGESEVIDIHHLDEDKHNNELSNLVPLCPTHHAYLHRGKSDLIFSKLIEYLDSRDVPH
jgi:hypothetical protein